MSVGAVSTAISHEVGQPLAAASLSASTSLGCLTSAQPDRDKAITSLREALKAIDRTFEVLHCPGHSPGSVVLVNRAQRFALMGDVLFQGSVGRTDLPLGSHEALMRSIRTKVLALPDDFAFICGHGPMSSIGQERRTNPFIVGDAA